MRQYGAMCRNQSNSILKPSRRGSRKTLAVSLADCFPEAGEATKKAFRGIPRDETDTLAKACSPVGPAPSRRSPPRG
jgi:hypothetical protein